VNAFAQGTHVSWSTFSQGFADQKTTGLEIRSVAGQNFAGSSVQGTTQVFSGFLADSVFRSVLLAVNETPAVPLTYSLQQNYPNPFNPTTRIAYSIPQGAGSGLQVAGSGKTAGSGLQVAGSGKTAGSGLQVAGSEKTAGSGWSVAGSGVRLVVYDVLGREIAVLVDGIQLPGRHEIVFDAGRLASGVYFYTLTAGTFKATKRMLLIR
jgi:hypothetical protein